VDLLRSWLSFLTDDKPATTPVVRLHCQFCSCSSITARFSAVGFLLRMESRHSCDVTPSMQLLVCYCLGIAFAGQSHFRCKRALFANLLQEFLCAWILWFLTCITYYTPTQPAWRTVHTTPTCTERRLASVLICFDTVSATQPITVSEMPNNSSPSAGFSTADVRSTSWSHVHPSW
jgi:hypothetical protein